MSSKASNKNISKKNTKSVKNVKNNDKSDKNDSFTLRDLLQAFIIDADKNLKLKLNACLNDKETDLDSICNTFLDQNKTKVKLMLKTEKKSEDEEKKALKKKKEEMGMPKRAKNVYQCFANDIRSQLIEDGLAQKDIFKATSDAWKEISAKDKKKYEKMADKDKARYKEEMEAYYEKHPDEKQTKKNSKNSPKKWNALTLWINENLAEYQENNPEMDEKDVKKQMKEEWKNLDKDIQKEWKDKAAAKNKNASSSSSEDDDEKDNKKTKVPKSKSKKSEKSDSDSDEKSSSKKSKSSKKSSSDEEKDELDLPLSELKKMAKDLEIKGYSTMKKQDLMDAIKAKKDVSNSSDEEEIKEEVDDLTKHKIPQLREIAKGLGIETKNLKRDELIEAIQSKRSGSDEEEDEGDEEELEDDE
jgi:hypothetical protein